MKKTINNSIGIVGLLVCLLLLSFTGNAQVAGTHFTVGLANVTSTSNTIEMDMRITVDGSVNSRLLGFSAGINYNTAIVNGGTLTFEYIGGRSQELSAFLPNTLNSANTPGHLRIAASSLSSASGIDVTIGQVLTLGRYRLTNSVAWSSASNAQLWLQNTASGRTATALTATGYGVTSGGVFAYSTSTPSSSPGVSLSQTSTSTLTLMLNAQVCATSASQTATSGVTCFGGSNGSSTITMSPTPTVSSITYTVDGGSSQSATLVAGAFTISGLSAGVHAVVISNTGCSNVTATGVSVSSPANLVASSSAGSIACNGGSTTLTVSATGGTAPYTGTGSFTVSAGSYSYTVTDANGCTSTTTGTVSQPANLVASSSAGSIACNGGSTTVTVSATGGTAPYTGTGSFTVSTGSYSYTVTDANGCTSTTTGTVSQPSQLTNTTSASACDSYTWSVTGQTYTESGTYTGTTTNGSGCTVDETLNLTINTNTITSQPSGATICKEIGASASMSVVSDSATATYQWYSQLATANPTTGVWTPVVNGANYSGATEATLNITRTTVAIPATGTKYRVVVSSGCGSGITSSYASILDQAISPKATAITAKSATNAALSPALTACEGSTLNLSLATGSIGNIQWMYSSDSGSTWSSFASYTQTALSATNGILNEVSPALEPGSAWFKVVVTNGVCSSIDSAILKLTVSAQPVAGTISGGDVTVCVPLATGFDASGAALTSPITNSTTLSLSGSSNVGTIVWEKSINYTAATPTWAAVTNLTATTAIGASASGAGTSALTVGNLAVDTWYRAKVTNGACVDYTSVVKITVSLAAKAGVVTAPLTACSTGDITFTSAAYVGSSIAWQVSTTSAATGYTTVAGETGLVFTMTNVPYAPLSKFYVRSVVTSGDCTSSFSAAKTVTVDPLSVGGTVIGGGTICSLGGGTLSLSGNVGKIQWQYSTDGGLNYVNAPSATVGSSSNFTTTSASSIAATYVVANVSSNTFFRALVTSGVCSSSVSNAVEFVLGTQAVAGTISAQSSTICAASGTTLTLSGNLGSIVWQKSTNWTAATPTWTAVTTSVTPTFSTGALAATTAFRAKVTIGLCSTVFTDTTVITVSPAAKGGTVAVNVAGTDVCIGSSKAMKVTANVGSIQWQMSTTSATADFVDVPGATTTPYTFTNITQATWFRVVATSGVCTTTSASNAVGITVSTTPAVAGTISGVNSVCTATGSTLSLAGSTGSIVWQKAVAPFTAWTAVAGATTSSLATGNLTATTAYRAVLTSGSCTAITDAYTVTVSPAAKATAISGNALVKTLATAICTSATAPLTLATGSIGTIEWQYYYAGSSATSVTNTSVVTWTPIVGATSTVYNASSDQDGNVWFRAVFTSGPCQTKAYSVPVNVWFKSCAAVKVASSVAFGVKVYPNPSSESFNFNLSTSSEEKVSVVVYDMTGKLVDSREVAPTEVSELQLGDRYPSGVYNMIVTQGDNTKTLRVIKR